MVLQRCGVFGGGGGFLGCGRATGAAGGGVVFFGGDRPELKEGSADGSTLCRSRASLEGRKRANGGGKPHRKIDYVMKCTMRKRNPDFFGCDSGVVVVILMSKVWGVAGCCFVACCGVWAFLTNSARFCFLGGRLSGCWSDVWVVPSTCGSDFFLGSVWAAGRLRGGWPALK